MRGPMAQLMQQAQRMQDDLKRAQEELAKLEVTGQSGGGMVSVTMNGRHEVRGVRIDRKLFADDPEMAEDLVAAAINDAVNRISAASAQRMGEVAGGMNLPPGFKLPF
ncbi:MAG: YbaB/EbfC family nucleoid-associated protein [Deltaproteobacteria bacterium]|nr:YbaB/EbfC family nucleoid-associated protein [Rudaea sp.]